MFMHKCQVYVRYLQERQVRWWSVLFELQFDLETEDELPPRGCATANIPFSSSGLPLCQNESKCETVLMKMCFTCKSIFMQIKLIFI